MGDGLPKTRFYRSAPVVTALLPIRGLYTTPGVAERSATLPHHKQRKTVAAPEKRN